jgi:hypothetical protein
VLIDYNCVSVLGRVFTWNSIKHAHNHEFFLFFEKEYIYIITISGAHEENHESMELSNVLQSDFSYPIQIFPGIFLAPPGSFLLGSIFNGQCSLSLSLSLSLSEWLGIKGKKQIDRKAYHDRWTTDHVEVTMGCLTMKPSDTWKTIMNMCR